MKVTDLVAFLFYDKNNCDMKFYFFDMLKFIGIMIDKIESLSDYDTIKKRNK